LKKIREDKFRKQNLSINISNVTEISGLPKISEFSFLSNVCTLKIIKSLSFSKSIFQKG